MGNTTQQNDRIKTQQDQHHQGQQRPGGGSQQGGSGQSQPSRQPDGTGAERTTRKDQST